MTTEPEPTQIITVTVRWHDGYIERFQASEVRSGCTLLWLRQVTGDERAIPLIGNVRWYSRSIESHQATP